MTGMLRAAVASLILAGPINPASAQEAPAAYPSKPIRVVVGFAPGGGNDILARIVSQKMQERNGWTVVVENKPGAGGRLSAEYVATQAPDGYTLLVGASGAMAVGPIVYKTNYQTLKSFAPVALMADFPMILVVSADHPAKTVKDLVAWTKANPEKANYATSSPAFSLPTELFKLKTGALGVAIPYRGSNESLLGVISGNAAMTLIDPPPATAQVQAGKLRALAVSARSRARELPDVPTMAEAGVEGVTVGGWSGFFAPAGTPRPIVDRLAREVLEIVQSPDVRERLLQMGTNPSGIGPDDLVRHIEAETRIWQDVVKAGNLTFSE